MINKLKKGNFITWKWKAEHLSDFVFHTYVNDVNDNQYALLDKKPFGGEWYDINEIEILGIEDRS